MRSQYEHELLTPRGSWAFSRLARPTIDPTTFECHCLRCFDGMPRESKAVGDHHLRWNSSTFHHLLRRQVQADLHRREPVVADESSGVSDRRQRMGRASRAVARVLMNDLALDA